MKSLETEIEDPSETFMSIQNAFIRLLDEDKADVSSMPKGFKNEKNLDL